MRTQEIYPHLFEICPLTMRTQGILLVKDATLLINHCLTDGGSSRLATSQTDPRCFVAGVKPSQWKRTCDKLVTRLDEYSDTLLQNIRRFIEIGDSRGAEIIQSSCAGCLAHLAGLCDLISRLEPNSKPQMDAICDSSLLRLGSLTQGMDFDGYSYLDVLLRVRHPTDQ
jgi:hypothetical protein